MAAKSVTKKRKQGEKTVEVPKTFTPRLWEDADGRIAIVKKIRRLAARYKEDSGADTIMKETLCDRAAFLRVRIESYESEGAAGKAIPENVLAAMTNTLMGVLKSVGLNKQASKSLDLETYLKSKGTK